MTSELEQPFQRRARLIYAILDSATVLPLYSIYQSGISPRMWETERKYFFERYPDVGYDKKKRLLYIKNFFEPEQVKL